MAIFLISMFTSLIVALSIYFLFEKSITSEFLNRYETHGNIVANALQHLETTADQINKNALFLLSNIEMAKGIPTNEALAKLAKKIGINAFYIIDKNGKFLRSSDISVAKQSNSLFSYDNDYKSLIYGKMEIASTPIIPSYPYDVPAKLTMVPNHNKTLILEACTYLQYISQILRQIIDGDNNIRSIGLYSPNGYELGFISSSGEFHQGKRNATDFFIGNKIMNDNIVFSIKIHASTKECPECFQKKVSNTKEYFYILKLQVSLIPLAKKNDILRIQIVMILIGILMFGLIFSKILSKKLVSRLEKINSTAYKIIKPGNLNLQVITQGRDEISHLAETFNKMIQALKTTQETLVESEKMRAIAKMAAQLAHDIRSPLAVMEITLLALSKNTSDAQRIMLSEAIQNVRDISNNLLERYRNDERNVSDSSIVSSEALLDDGNIPRPLLLSSLIENVISQKRQEWHDKPCFLKIIISSCSRGQWIIAAPNQIKRALSNLLNNAYEAIELERDIQIELTKIENKLQLKISDSGQGIPSDKIDAVLSGVSFKHKGEGLGLVSAKRYLSSLEGELTLSSVEFEGADVILCFPIAPQPVWFPSSIVICKNTIIVILDDDPSIHNLWRHRLELYEVKIYHFLTIDELIQWCKNNSDLFSRTIFLMDYEIKDNVKSGLDLLEMFDPGSRGYLITSHGEETIIQQRCEKLCVNLIPKCLLGVIPIEIYSL